MADKLTIVIGAKNLTGRVFRAIGTGLKKLSSAAKSAFRSIGRAASTALKVTTAAVVAFAVTSIKAASDAEAVESKFRAVFKNLSKDVEDWSKTFSRSVGRASVDIREMLAGVQDLFVPMGIARDEAAELSKAVVKLAVDVASFNGKADADVIQDFKSALVGSSETVRKYGVVLTEANVAQEAVTLGLAKSKKEVSDAAKIQARLSLIIKGTSDAQGNAKDTAKEFMNVIKRLKSAFSDLQREVGLQLIKGLELGRNFQELGTKFIDFTNKIKSSGAIQEWAANARKALAPIREIINALFEGGEQRKIAIQGIKDVGVQLAKSAIAVLIEGGKRIGFAIAEGIKGAASRRVQLEAQARAELRDEGKISKTAERSPLFSSLFSKRLGIQINEKVREIQSREAAGGMKDILSKSGKNVTLGDVVDAINKVPDGNKKKLAAG